MLSLDDLGMEREQQTHVLSNEGLAELVKQIEPNEELDEDVQEVRLCVEEGVGVCGVGRVWCGWGCGVGRGVWCG